MLKKFFRFVSTFLVLVMLVNMVPVQALDELQTGEMAQIGGTETVPTVSSDGADSAAIVAEIPEGRSEYTKEFLLSNGLHIATVYAEPVHYEKDGKWEDIDNTLVANTSGTYQNTAGPWAVSFPQSFGSTQAVTVTKDGYTLSFGLPQRLTVSSGAAVMSAESTAEPLAAAQAESVTAQLSSKAELFTELAEHPETVLENLSSRLTYENVHSDTNVVYDLTSNRVKESIVLAKQDAALRGFRYTLNVGTMVPALQEDGSILFYDENQSQIVMVMPAPYLLDASYEISTDVTVTLTGQNGSYVLTYLLPQQWLAGEDRQWPVILDPVIQADLEVTNIRDATVCSTGTISPYAGFLETGYLTNRGISRTYVKYTEIPALTSADVIVSAQITMYQRYNRSTTIPVEVHKVSETWDSETITWGNKPDPNPLIEDFVMSHDARWYTWDVTDIAREWYATGTNNGMMFKVSDAVETGGTEDFRQFLSSDFGEAGRPTLFISFRNNNGLESYWNYTSSSAGRAGTGYVNDYTGNLTWIRSDIGFGGSRMPVSISHAYNANDAGNNNFGMGYGWRTNYNQRLYRWDDEWDQDGDGIIQSDERWYVWEDSDGTSHYFYWDKEEEEYRDEDNLDLTLTVNSSGDSRYILTDKDGNTSHFDAEGRLYKLENDQESPSSATITYTDSTSKLISTITDGVNRVYSFTYTDGLLTRISYKSTGTEEISYVSYSYTDGNLTRITDKDGKHSSYTYNDHLMTSAQDVDDYMLVYTYHEVSGSYAPRRVASIQEYDFVTPGGHITMAYGNHQTVFTDVVNGTTLISQFNQFGNTISVQDSEGKAQYAGYARNNAEDATGKGNQLTLSSKLQNTVINLLNDSSFEDGTLWETVASCTGSIAETGYLGSKSLKLTSPSSGYLKSPTFTAKAGRTYTFSAYVKTESGSSVYIGVRGDHLQTLYVPSAPDWTRVEVSYTNSTQTDHTAYAVFIALGSSNVTAYLDCVQVEEMPTASRYNLVSDGDFSFNSNKWTGSNLADGDAVAAAPDASPVLSANAYKITGEYTTEKTVKQTIAISGGEGDSYVFGGWAMGDSASLANYEDEQEKDFAIRCTIHYDDDTTKAETVSFNADLVQWQLVTGAIAAEKDYSEITIEIVYKNNANTVYFDGLQLFKEEFGVSYTYDDDGNVISVIDLQNKETEYEYDENGNLTAIIEDGSRKMEYTYDDHHNVRTATNEEGQVYTFNYDIYGNNTQVSITENEVTMSSQAAYTGNGNYMSYARDALGNTTYYGYDEDTGMLEWVKYPKDTNATRTEYTYDNMYRMTKAEADTNSGLNLSAEYIYNNQDQLSAITTPSTTYSFTYGDFSLRSAIKIGERTLAGYSYETQTNRLIRLDYGNQDSVSYTYDDQGRLILETYEDGETVRYAYDNSGNLATVTDSETGVVTTYFYDLLNRQSGYRETGASLNHSVTYLYDAKNHLSSMTETIGEVTKTYTYTYNEFNRLTSMTVDGVTVEYTYDDFGRLTQQVTKQGETVILTEPVTYSPGSGTGTTSGQVRTYNGVTYTYDQNGNITYYGDGQRDNNYYQYDSQNQLIRAESEDQNRIQVWTYDNAGNILSRKEYAYSDYNLQTPLESVTYTYGDTEWGDLLTAYNGNAITYDNIGNPLSDGTWTYTWKHGRQLVSMAKSGTTWNYTYGADGLRTKRTSGSTTYSYVYNGDKLTQMSVGNYTYDFTYDASGTPLTITVNDYTYYYVTNLQGDVVGILDEDGDQVITYYYTAWGEVTYVGDDQIGWYNPLRYRGYVYDSETGLYYLQSRYYNPEWGRFINADAYASTGQGFIGNNMFAYCLNNPVNNIDISGYNSEVVEWWTTTMWWLCGIDTALPVGDIVYGAGIVILGIFAITSIGEEDPQIDLEDEDNGDNSTADPPDVTFPGNDPTIAPGDDFEWRGKMPVGGDQGAWVNPKTGEQWHPDLNHKFPKGPHWDYTDVFGVVWTVYENGKIILWP